MGNQGQEPYESSADAAHLIELIANEEQSVHKWIQFFITIEAGLAVGLGFVLQFSCNQPTGLWLPVARVLIPVIGVSVAVALSMIILRERQWIAWYIQQFNALPGRSGRVFPVESGVIAGQPIGFLSKVVLSLGAVVVLAWLLVAFVL